MTKTITKSAKVAKPATKKPATKKAAPKKLTAAEADKIVESKSAVNTAIHFVRCAGGQDLTFPTARWSGEIREASKIGQSFKALQDLLAKPVPAAKLAKGITGRDAPHASKAIADANAKAKPVAKKAAEAKKAVKAEAKAKAAKPDRPYKHLVKLADITLRPGTWTEYMVQTIMSHKTTAAANAASQAKRDREFGGKKLDFKWTADAKKYIAFTD